MAKLLNGWVWENQHFDPGGDRDISAQQEEPLELGLADMHPLPQGELSDLLLEPQVRITMNVAVAWVDVFGKEWSETWKMQAIGPLGLDADIQLFPDF